MMTASVLAKRTNVPLFTVRYYTRIGLLKPSRDLRNGYRVYNTADKDRLKFITSAKELGFTLAEIESVLNHAHHGDSPCPMVREIVERRIEETKETIKHLQSLQGRLEGAVKMWKKMKNASPTGTSVCRLIESFANDETSA
jgi:MerR family transcriptional regulator, Zn(II)-responsive regulator of zntA